MTSCDTVHWAFHGSEFNLCLAWVPPQRHFVTVSSVYLKRPNESSLFFFFSLWLNCVRVCVCVWKREIPFWAASLPFINKRCSLQTNRQGAGPGSGSGYGYGVGAKPGSTTVTGLGSRMGFCCFAFDPEKWKYNKKMLPPFVSEIFSYLSNCFFFFFLVFILETKWGNGECRLDAFLNSGRSALVSTRRQSINLSANTPPLSSLPFFSLAPLIDPIMKSQKKFVSFLSIDLWAVKGKWKAIELKNLPSPPLPAAHMVCWYRTQLSLLSTLFISVSYLSDQFICSAARYVN